MRIEDALQVTAFQSEKQKLTLNLMYTAGWLNGKLSQFLKPYDLTQQQYNVLRILRGCHPEPATVNLLIERMVDKQSNASRLVEKLRQKGLVNREVCSHDRRRVDVFITENGMSLLADLDEAVMAFHEDTMALSEAELQQLNSLLDRLRVQQQALENEAA